MNGVVYDSRHETDRSAHPKDGSDGTKALRKTKRSVESRFFNLASIAIIFY